MDPKKTTTKPKKTQPLHTPTKTKEHLTFLHVPGWR